MDKYKKQDQLVTCTNSVVTLSQIIISTLSVSINSMFIIILIIISISALQILITVNQLTNISLEQFQTQTNTHTIHNIVFSIPQSIQTNNIFFSGISSSLLII